MRVYVCVFVCVRACAPAHAHAHVNEHVHANMYVWHVCAVAAVVVSVFQIYICYTIAIISDLSVGVCAVLSGMSIYKRFRLEVWFRGFG